MRIIDTLRSASNALTANRGRAALTMLGIIIGVGSVVLMVSLGNSFERYILSQVESVGSGGIDIYPTGFEKFGGNLNSLTFEDFEQIRRLTTVDRVTPVIMVGKPVTYGREERSPMVMGTYPTIFGNYGLSLERGRLLEESDIDGAKNVVVLSSQTAEDFFGNANPVGKNITIGGQSLTVVGVLQSVGSLLLQDLDKPVYLPFTTARALTGQRHLSFITVKTVGNTELAKRDIVAVLRQSHGIKNPENDSDLDDFIVRSSEQITTIISSVTLGLTIFLGLVAGISLLVGGIGIMNIMLVSVSERTKEIGLRKAVGARRKDVLLQFLVESTALTLVGGITGIILGGGLGWLLARLADRVLGGFDFTLSLSSILLAVGMALTVGLVFGLYPARRAANLSPMEAMRYE